jgi:hypothetical protein
VLTNLKIRLKKWWNDLMVNELRLEDGGSVWCSKKIIRSLFL